MDQETLNWICAHRPRFRKYQQKKIKLTHAQFSSLPLKRKWFLEPRIINGIHGIRHALRVSIYAGILAASFGLSQKEQGAVAIAALLHDIRRKNDKGDVNHATRCASWLRAHSSDVSYLRFIATDQRVSILAAIKLHEIPYEGIVDSSEYKKNRWIVDMLKTADALDRYRLPKLKWWINDVYLKIKPSERLRALAFDLTTISEQLFLHGASNRDAVSLALKALKIRV